MTAGLDCPHGMGTKAACTRCMETGGLGVPAGSPNRLEVSNGPTRTAQYGGRCWAGGDQIRPGDTLVHTTRNRWVHPACLPHIPNTEG